VAEPPSPVPPPQAAQQKKSGLLKYKNGVAYIADPIKTTEGEGDEAAAELASSQMMTLGGIGNASIAPKVTEVTHWMGAGEAAGSEAPEVVPQWIAFDRRVLRFFGYFKEPVVESAQENFRIRKVTLFYYLEDGTMHMGEPREDNSGIPQGVFLKRHVAELDSGEILGVGHLTVGANLTLYGRTFHITACDEFTREFLTAQGVEVAADEGVPEDPYRLKQTLKAARSTQRPSTRGKALEDLKKFFDYDRKVLRFFAVWDDRRALYGDNLAFVVHYYLSDDTVEVNEVHSRNTGRDSFPKLLARGKLPKNHEDTGTFINRQIRYYEWQDMMVGQKINVWGRGLLLYDCDEFTRSWYRKQGVPEEALAPLPVDVERKLSVPKMAVAPDWYGIGTERDQMQSVNMLIPKPPRFDWDQFMEHGTHQLRFAARLVADQGCKLLPADDVRLFVISYYLADDTIQIYEPPIRNSGIIGGKYLERCHLKKPHAVNQEYRSRDLFIGARIATHARCFELYDADIFTYDFMERHADKFPLADVSAILAKCRAGVATEEGKAAVLGSIQAATDEATGCVPVPEVAAGLEAAGVSLVPHELVVLARHVGEPEGKAPVPAVKLLAELGLEAAE